MMRKGSQSCLAWPLFRILGSRNCFSTSSMLQHSLKSRLCFRNTLRKFFEVDRTPLIRSCEFQAFSREGRAVSTLRPSSCLLRAATSRRLPSKLGVRMLRLEISAAMGLSRRGEGAQRWWERRLKKSGGSLELLMRMFLRRAKLWLRFGGRRGESSLQNCMLEIQLFDRPSASHISCFHYIHIQRLPHGHPYNFQAHFCYCQLGTVGKQKWI